MPRNIIYGEGCGKVYFFNIDIFFLCILCFIIEARYLFKKQLFLNDKNFNGYYEFLISSFELTNTSYSCEQRASLT